ncbi:histidine phosphatase family protein [Lactobacillus sp. ESL0679]|uniref:histidine phosphatase family protein n=1 Tax=Lactobacillus sp. ESL0679 TaxID=2983209 RepID=UPI0023F9AF60|nr:histidine phosphatase family protein [Lactobacillus sp. ESL0679]MDF7682393.1 histidine phosphatase family protein [Lactobacillus sp. ESL0679]
MLNVYLVRHGQTETNKTHLLNGSLTNLPLNEVGIKQVEALQASFDTKQIDCIYTSPLLRAYQTAEILDQGQHEIFRDDRLKEINFGNWDGKLDKDIYAKYPQAFDELGHLKENYSNYCTGESFQHLKERATSFWRELVQNHEDENILLVTHGFVIRSLTQVAFSFPAASPIGEVKNASVSSFSIDDKSKNIFLNYYNRITPSEFLITR